MKKLILLSISLLVPAGALWAQRPLVSGISPKSATVNETVTITGSNLPTGTDAHVQFGAAKGTVLEASSTQMKVSVPAGASLDGVTVTSKSSALSAKSTNPFLLSFGGTSFDPTSFAAEVSYARGTGMYDMCSCDFNEDGLVDVITTHENDLSLSTYTNASTGPSVINFTVGTIRSHSALTRNLICGDLDGDGKPDLAVSGGGVYANRIIVFKNISPAGGALTFELPQTYLLPVNGAAMLSMQDLNTDGRPELVVTNKFANSIFIFKNTSSAGMLRFDSQIQEITVNGPQSTHGLAVQDLDGDGLADIALTGLYERNAYLLRNTSSSGTIAFAAPVVLPSPTDGLHYLVATDLNGDGKADLAATDYFNKNVTVWQNSSSSGNLQFGTAIPFATFTGPWGIAAGDVDGNGQTDLVVSSHDARGVNVFTNTSTGGALTLTGSSLTVADNGRHTNLVDFSGDGKPDIAYTGKVSSSLRILRNKHCVVPKITPSETITLCAGQTADLQATKALGVTYRWTRNGTALSATEPTLTVTESGTYVVTLSSAADGCSISSNAVVVVAGSGTGTSVAMEPIAASCVGGSAVLKATAISGATYVWNGPNGFTTTTTSASHTLTNVQAAAAGSYSVVIKAGDCQFTPAAQTLTINSNPQPQITASATAFCAGTSVTLQAQPGFASYQWKLNGANYTGTGATTSSISTNTAGSYTVVMGNSAGCKGESAAVAITQTQAPVAGFTAPATACLQQAVSFQNSSSFQSGQTPTYLWTFGDGTTSTEANPAHTYPAVGTYTVNLTVSYGTSSCSNSTSKTIAVVASPEVQLIAEGSTSFCPGESVLLRLEGDVASVSWSTGATTPTLTATSSGTYKATVKTSAGCTLEKTIELSYLPVPEITLSASTSAINVGESVTLTAGGALRYEWGQAEGITDPFSHTVTVAPVATTTYTVSGWGDSGCAATAEITITVDNSLRLNPPKIFVPAIDGTWTVNDIELYPDLRLTLVNSLGRPIFEAAPYLNNWDGTEKGQSLEPGVYYYIFKDASGKVAKTGSVTLLR